MAASAQLAPAATLAQTLLESHAQSPRNLQLSLAASYADMRAAQRLRHQVFIEEIGATLDCAETGIESDRYDPYCQHLLVRDSTTDRVIGCYRILTDSQALYAGGFYSETEFNISRILALPGRFMEVGRTCVHPDYRNGATLGLLWAGLARFMVINKFDYLMGCASISMQLGLKQVAAICHHLRLNHLSDPHCRVSPRTPVPMLHGVTRHETVELPPLLKGYMRLGAKICGEPAWDKDFNVADLFILLKVDDLSSRYLRHFVNRV